MRTKIKYAFIILAFGLSLSASAQTTDVNNAGSAKVSDPTFQLVSCSPKIDPKNPGVLQNDCNYAQVIFTFSRIINFVLYLLSSIVLGMVLYMGFKYLTANGDTGKLADAKRMFTPIVIGVTLIFGAYVIVYKFILTNLVADEGVGGVSKADIIGTGGSK